MLRLDPLLAAAKPCAGTPCLKRVQDIFHICVPSPIWLRF